MNRNKYQEIAKYLKQNYDFKIEHYRNETYYLYKLKKEPNYFFIDQRGYDNLFCSIIIDLGERIDYQKLILLVDNNLRVHK